MEVELSISKSIANRWLMLQAIHGDGLMPVSAAMPDDVRLLHDALQALNAREQGVVLTLDLQNCGTAMRFLTAYCAQLPDCEVLLTGAERMQQRPIGQLVDALRTLGAEVKYAGKEGFPPLRIHGKALDVAGKVVEMRQPQSSQFVSALMMIGVEMRTDCTSPYIYMTRRLMEEYAVRAKDFEIERDWSAAAFWYEYVALHGGEITLRGLRMDSLQGDRAVVNVFEQLGVLSYNYPITIHLTKRTDDFTLPQAIDVDFTDIPDLYPAVALTCERLGVVLHASGTACLRWKESDRLDAVAHHRTCSDHRMAMALMAAGYEVDDTECVSKSYPQFISQLCKLRP